MLMKSTISIFFVVALSAFNHGITTDGKVVSTFPGWRNNNVPIWEIDKDHSSVCFMVKHMGIAEVKGFFRTFSGTMESAEEDFSDALIKLSVDVNSIDSNNEARDTHLKSNDFFNAVQFPQMTFESKSFKKQKGDNYKLSGILTIRDVSRNVSFDVEYLGSIAIIGIEKVAFKAVTKINRLDYNIQWNQTTPDGILILGNEVTIELNLEMNKSI